MQTGEKGGERAAHWVGAPQKTIDWESGGNNYHKFLKIVELKF